MVKDPRRKEDVKTPRTKKMKLHEATGRQAARHVESKRKTTRHSQKNKSILMAKSKVKKKKSAPLEITLKVSSDTSPGALSRLFKKRLAQKGFRPGGGQDVPRKKKKAGTKSRAMKKRLGGY
tara:strand:+ start:1273 stop:1638 length:366 start_codon:yes stop_codon:yes gene_type:complete